MRESSSKQILLSVLGVAILVVAVVGVSFAVFSFSQAGKSENTISTGTLSMTFSELTNGISITNAMPMTDATGKALSADNEKFDFTVGASITGTAVINYEISAKKDPASTIENNHVKLYLEKDGAQSMAPKVYTPEAAKTAIGTEAGDMLLETGTFNTTLTNSYTLRMWLAENAPIDETARTFTVTVNVHGTAVNP